jgi:hypothetical protein
MARPTKYTEDMPQRVLAWLELKKDTVSEFHKTRGERSDSYERILEVNLPTIKGLSSFLDVNEDSIYQWDKEGKDKDYEGQYKESKVKFSETLEKVRKEQHDRLIKMSLSGDYNPTITKLLLMSNFGYKERSDMTTDDKEIQGVVVLPAKKE